MTAETLAPDVLLTQTNLVGALTDIDDDPGSPDGLWLTASNNNANSVCIVSFGTPTDSPTTGAGVQTFQMWARASPNARNIDWSMYLLEGGVRRNGGTAIATGTLTNGTSGEMVSGTWDAALLSTADGSAVECEVVFTKTGGSPSNRTTGEVGAVEWNADVSEALTPVSRTLDSRRAIDAEVSAMPDLRRALDIEMSTTLDLRRAVYVGVYLEFDARRALDAAVPVTIDVRRDMEGGLTVGADFRRAVEMEVYAVFDARRALDAGAQRVLDLRREIWESVGQTTDIRRQVEQQQLEIQPQQEESGMARIALTTAWTAIATAKTGAFVQNKGSDPILVAVAASEPAALAEVGYTLQADDFLPLSGLASTNIYARTTSGTGAVEAVTIA